MEFAFQVFRDIGQLLAIVAFAYALFRVAMALID
jgi:hypothetical protein